MVQIHKSHWNSECSTVLTFYCGLFRVEEELMVSSSSLPACPAYYLVSAAKAELLMKLKEMQPSGPGEEEEMYPDLTEKKVRNCCVSQ